MEKKNKQKMRVLAVCKDAGSANALTAFICAVKEKPVEFSIVCFAKTEEIFQASLIVPDFVFEDDIDKEEMEKIWQQCSPELVLLGTSMDSLSEREFCLMSVKKHLPCISLVDWWSNFGLRFSTPGTLDLKFIPDRIAVMDEDAASGCKAAGVPAEKIAVTGNPYWDRLLDMEDGMIHKMRKKVRSENHITEEDFLVLVVSSNIRNLGLELGYDENDFWKLMSPFPQKTNRNRKMKILIKPHPRENRNDLKDLLSTFFSQHTMLEDCSALEAVAAADSVFGMCSSVLFEAALLGKKVVSVQPNKNEERLRFLKIFDHLRIPTVRNMDEKNNIMDLLREEDLPFPLLDRLPADIANKASNKNLMGLVTKSLALFKQGACS